MTPHVVLSSLNWQLYIVFCLFIAQKVKPTQHLNMELCLTRIRQLTDITEKGPFRLRHYSSVISLTSAGKLMTSTPAANG